MVNLLNIILDGLATSGGGEGELNLASTGYNKVLGLVLVSVGMSANDDGLGPARDETRDVGNNDGLTEDGSSEDVSDGSVGAGPHFLQAKLCREVSIPLPLNC